MTLVELEVRLKEMKVNADTMIIIHYNSYMFGYNTESNGIDIMLTQVDEWGNYKIIEWLATVNHVKDVIKIVQ